MTEFSERMGLSPRAAIQIQSMDDRLRNGLWNCLYLYWKESTPYHPAAVLGRGDDLETRRSDPVVVVALFLWTEFFGQALDAAPRRWSVLIAEIRARFYECDWNRVYDLIEFFDSELQRLGMALAFQQQVNRVLESNSAGYRSVGGVITPLTDPIELAEVKRAASPEGTKPHDLARIHINDALQKLSDRARPDYRNSIKESISAVECVCNYFTGESNLHKALLKLKTQAGIHSALLDGIEKLYGYAGDEDGVRHAISSTPTVGVAEALFMLVTCSAIVNFLLGKVPELRNGASPPSPTHS